MLNTEQRLEYNLKIVDKLKELVTKYPELRFHQLLFNIGIIESNGFVSNGQMLAKDKYGEEPNTTLKKLELHLEKLGM